jgi:hypothetical protein
VTFQGCVEGMWRSPHLGLAFVAFRMVSMAGTATELGSIKALGPRPFGTRIPAATSFLQPLTIQFRVPSTIHRLDYYVVEEYALQK